MNEQLIEAVRKRPVLYETNKKTYKDCDAKNKAWSEVAEEIGQNGNIFDNNVW